MVGSSSGSLGWQKAFLQSACFKVVWFQTASAAISLMMGCEMTGAWHSALVHCTGSLLPRTKIHDFTHFGLPSELGLIVKMFIIIGMAVPPVLFWVVKYSSSEMKWMVLWLIKI